MVKQLIYTTIMFLFLSSNVYAEDKLGLGMCGADIKMHCSASHDEHAKHNCLSKVDESKLSKSCLEYRKKMTKQDHSKISDDHKHDEKGHKHQ